ncbi:MAG TPA: Ig-like domain-containing protein, partial [Actinophytocola sp.]|uniref:Ig-like domain-containing protein n=1 Tax=Actinophytocola sp. TaxID=1872138 RepID=UPI002DBFE968
MGSEPMSSGTAGSKARRGMARVAAVVLLAGLTVGGLVAAPRPAQAATVNFLVNSLSHQGDDALVGDRVCATAAGVCTLRAALQESNALPTADEAIIAPAEDVDADTPGIQSTGTIVGSGTGTANWMFVGVLTPLGDNGALFHATRSVTLDFQNRLGIRSLSDVDGVTALFIDGPNVAVRNFPNITSNETAFVVGANGDRAIIENGVSIDPASIVAERFLWLASGADGVTVRNVELGSFTGSTSAVRFAANATINDFTLDRVRMYDPDNETYNGVGAHGSAATLNRLRITGSTFEGFNGYPLLLTNITLSDSLISGNTFTRTDNNDMVLRLTRAGFGPVNVIANNTFDNAGSNARNAIWASLGLSVGTDQSGFRIEDNYINGFTERGIFLGFGGTLTVQRNRFGPQSFGDADVAAESGFTVLFLNNGTASNSAIRTWYPTEVTYDTNTCQLAVAVAPPTAGTPPQTPVTIDVYYTATTKAEVYLGRATGITAATTITVPYSLGAGNIRVQTQGANAQSSHYSRTVPQLATDRCSPRATLEQTQSQADPTSVRDLLFTVEFSEVITENLVTGDFTTTGSTAQGVTVTDVTRVSPNSFSVRARANSSGTVVLSLVAGAVLDPDGNASQASVSTDNSVTYVSPLTLAPTELTVTEGQPAQTYTVTSSLSATDPITVTPTVVDPRWATVTPNPLEIDTTQTAGDLSVEAVDDALISPTHVTQITHTVSSADPNFDGLLLPDVTVTVLDNDQPVAATSELTVTAGEVVANGTATHTATVTVRNATGGPVAAVLVTFQAESGAHLVIPSCTSGGDGTCTVDITSVLAGSYDIRAFIGGAETGGSPATAVFVPGPAAATTSVITATPATITADGVATSTITVQLRDAQGNNLTTGGATVTIGTDNGAISGVTDNGNGTYTATLTGPTTVGTATLTFTLDGAPGTDTATVAFVPGPADPGTSTIAADPTTIVADGTSTSTVTVQLKDAQGNNLTSGGATVVIATDYGTVSGVTDNGDGSYTATLTSVTVAGTATLSFTVNGAAASATATVSFVAGVADPTTSVITADPVSITADGVSTSTVTVQLRGPLGNNVTFGGADVTIGTDRGTVSAVTDNLNGTYTATLTAATTAGVATLTFTLAGTPGTDTATVAFVPGPMDLGTSTITAAPAAISADGIATSTVTVQLKDAQGNNLTSGGATVVVGTDLGVISGVTDNGNGSYTATLTSVTTAGTATLSFTVDGAAGTDTATVAFVTGTPDATTSVITADPSVIIADGTSTSTITVRLRDTQGNDLTAGGAHVTIATDYGTISGVTDNGNGTYTATLTSVTVAGTATLSFTLEGATAPATATVSFVAGTANPTTSLISANPTTITADGTSTSTVTVQLRGPLGNNVTFGGHNVTIGTDLGTVSAVTDNNDGTYTATLTSATTAGTATLTFTLEGATGTNTATVAFVPGPADPVTSTITAAPAAISADGIATSTVTVQLKDAQGNNLTSGGATVVVGTDLGAISGVTDNGNGSYTATLTSVTTAGTATLSFTIDGAAGTDTATVQFVLGTPDATTSTITADPTTILADGTSTSTVTVQLKDNLGNNLTAGGAQVTIATDYGTISGVTDNGNGSYTATLTSVTVAGTATLSFTVNGIAAPATAAVVMVAGTANPTTSLISANPTTITADGTSTSTVTVQLRGPLGNNVTFGGHNVTIGTDLGTVSAVTDNNNGTYTATLTSATTAGTATVTFTLEGATGTDTATVAFVPGPAAAATSVITADPTTIIADGTSTSTVTVQLKDAQGNNLTSGGATVVVATDYGTVSGVTDNNNGTYTATLTSVTVAGTATLTFTLDGAAGTDTATVSFVAGTANPTTSVITADPVSITADGISTATVTVQLRGPLGNNITTGGHNVGIGTSLGTVSGVTDNNDGTYTATLTSATTAGTATVTFTLEGTLGTDTATVEFAPGPAVAATSVITADPTATTANGIATSTITVRLRDAQGNNLTTGGATVVIATTAGILLDQVVDNGDGSYTESLTSTTTVGIAEVSFTVNGSPGGDTATVEFVAGPAVAGTSEISAAPTSITADGAATATVTVRLRDANGNNLTTGGATVAISTDLGALSTVTDNADGTYTATLTAPTAVGTATLTFTVAGVAGTRTATVGFVAGPADPARSEITAAPTAITADSESTSTITVRLRDAQGNDLTTGGATVVVAADLGAVSTVTDNNDGTYTATLTSGTTAGLATLSFTVGGSLGTDTATVDFVAGAPDATTSVITAVPVSITADEVATSTVTVQLRDAQGNNLSAGGAHVLLATDLGTVSAVTDNGDGTYTATLTSGTTAGPATLSFTVNGDPATATATVAFVAGPADVATSTITAVPTPITADGTSTSTVTVQLKDAQGNNLTSGGATVAITSDFGTTSGVTDNGDGTYTATLTSATAIGIATVSFTIDDLAGVHTATVEFVAGPPDPGTSVLTANPTSITAGGTATSTATVQLLDANGNDVTTGTAAVVITTDLGTMSPTTRNGDGTYTATLTAAPTAGTATLSFTVDGAPGADTATVQVLPGTAAATTSVITADPTSIPADGASTSTATVQLKDANGNNLTTGGATVVIGTDLGTVSGVTDNDNGTYTATFTSATTPGTATLTFTVDGTAATATATVTLTGSADPGTSTITAAPTSITADGAATSAVTVQL